MSHSPNGVECGVPMRLGLASLLWMLITGCAAIASAQIKMEIVGPQKLSAIAVSQLKNLGGDDEGKVSGQFVHTLARDLTLSGYFKIIDPHAYIEDPQASGYQLGQFNFADWSSLRAEFLVKGSVNASDQGSTVQAFLFDVGSQKQLLGKQFSGGGEDVGRMARRFADAILEAVTGRKGPFDTMLAMVSTRGGRFKEVYTMSVDGEELFRVTNNPTINISPSFDKQARHVLYTSFKSGAPGLYVYDLKNRSEIAIRSSSGNLIGGCLMPSGDQIVAAVERHGETNLYTLDLAGNVIRHLTDNGSINVAPAVSPDGGRIAFTSDRGGTPQIYVMSSSGGGARRITYRGSYNTNPAFSPNGDRIAYQSRSGSGFGIYLIAASGGQPSHLADGQHPAWSPDGRYIVYSSNLGGLPDLYLTQVESGKMVGKLSKEDGNATDPAWSWWLGD